MTTVVTVPGASGTYIPNPYSTPYNLDVAQQISTLLFSAEENDALFVQDSDENPGTVPAGYVGELAVTLPGASNIVVPPGYTFTAIAQSVTGPLTVSGGGSLFVGNQNVGYYGAPAAAPVYVAAGNGNDLISLPDGSFYVVGLGNGNDTVFADGTGTVTGGDGANLFFVGSPGTQNVINAYGNSDTIVASAGAATVTTYGSDPQVFGGSGQLVYLGGSAGAPTITGPVNGGAESLYGGWGQNITYQDGSSTVPGAAVLAAGVGNETLDAGGSHDGVYLAAGSGSVDMIGSTGPDTFFGGSGYATMTGNGGADLFLFGYTAGQAPGTDIITDFNSSDTFAVSGYGANAAQTALNNATVAGGNLTVQLSDKTTITFLGITNPTSIHNQSY